MGFFFSQYPDVISHRGARKIVIAAALLSLCAAAAAAAFQLFLPAPHPPSSPSPTISPTPPPLPPRERARGELQSYDITPCPQKIPAPAWKRVGILVLREDWGVQEITTRLAEMRGAGYTGVLLEIPWRFNELAGLVEESWAEKEKPWMKIRAAVVANESQTQGLRFGVLLNWRGGGERTVLQTAPLQKERRKLVAQWARWAAEYGASYFIPAQAFDGPEIYRRKHKELLTHLAELGEVVRREFKGRTGVGLCCVSAAFSSLKLPAFDFLLVPYYPHPAFSEQKQRNYLHERMRALHALARRADIKEIWWGPLGLQDGTDDVVALVYFGPAAETRLPPAQLPDAVAEAKTLALLWRIAKPLVQGMVVFYDAPAYAVRRQPAQRQLTSLWREIAPQTSPPAAETSPQDK